MEEISENSLELKRNYKNLSNQTRNHCLSCIQRRDRAVKAAQKEDDEDNSQELQKAFSKEGLQEAKAGNAGGEVTPPQSG